jgi:hypothetical protein
MFPIKAGFTTGLREARNVILLDLRSFALVVTSNGWSYLVFHERNVTTDARKRSIMKSLVSEWLEHTS